MLGGRLMRLVYLLVIAALLTVALRLSPHLTAYAMRLPAPPTEAVESAPPLTFTVAQGMSPDAIGKSLVDAGILTDIRRYNLLVSLDGAGRELRAGCYIFSKSTPASELVRRLRGGITSAKLIPIPEGRRLEEIGTIVERAGITTEADWAAALKNAPRNRLPVPPPPSRSLLGYLLPASYPLQCQASAPDLVASMLDAFTAQVTPEIISAAKSHSLSLDDTVILASIVEREAVQKAEQPIIASVFINRLKVGLPLQADPTVQFALANAQPPSASGTWWKTQLTTADLAIDSAYNTYKHAGLPPGPIANPGIDAIRAVANPAPSDYLYFVAKGDGAHAFARTLAEHNDNVAKYQK